MFKLMIADDNPHILQELSEIVDWENYDFDLIGTFQNGQALLDAAKQSIPDLVITDIVMPVMDGIHLAAELRLLNSSIKIVFISSYSEFNYAKEALKFRIFDYLLKPVQINQLHDVISRVFEELRLEELERFNQQKINLQQEVWRKTALSHYLSVLLHASEDEDTISEELSHLGFIIKPGIRLLLACFSFDSSTESLNKLPAHNYLYSILTVEDPEIQVVPIHAKKSPYCFLLLTNNQRLRIPNVLSKICIDIEAKTDLRIIMGYSTISERFTDLPLLYTQAKAALEHLIKEPIKTPIASYTDVNMLIASSSSFNPLDNTPHSDIVAIMKAYIEENYMRPITTNDVALQVFFSPSYANHCFTEECGNTIFGYLTQYRIEKAKQFLTETDESITNIAEQVGYSSKTSFYLAFKRHTGVSPTIYRNDHAI